MLILGLLELDTSKRVTIHRLFSFIILTMKNKWIWAFVILLILSFAVIGFSSRKNSSTPTGTNADLKYEVTADEHIIGSPDAKVVIVEYADLQCPACKAYSSLLNQAVQAYGSNIAVVFRHFPLVEIHSRAIPGAKAVEAAGAQGKFFEMVDILYTNQDEWVKATKAEDVFIKYAQTLGLDLIKFKADSSSKTLEDLILGQREQAQKMNLSGTPSLFINGKSIPLPQTGQEFQKVIDDELARVNAKQTQ